MAEEQIDPMGAKVLLFLEKVQERLCLSHDDDAGDFTDFDKLKAVEAAMAEAGLRFLGYIVESRDE